MSDRVNRIIFYLKNDKKRSDVIDTVSKQIDILLKSGYNCFLTEFKDVACDDTTCDAICIEFCISDPEAKNKDILQPCWLFLDELEYLSKYQLESILQEAQETISSVSKEIEEENKDTENDDSSPTEKKDDYDA